MCPEGRAAPRVPMVTPAITRTATPAAVSRATLVRREPPAPVPPAAGPRSPESPGGDAPRLAFRWPEFRQPGHVAGLSFAGLGLAGLSLAGLGARWPEPRWPGRPCPRWPCPGQARPGPPRPKPPHPLESASSAPSLPVPAKGPRGAQSPTGLPAVTDSRHARFPPAGVSRPLACPMQPNGHPNRPQRVISAPRTCHSSCANLAYSQSLRRKMTYRLREIPTMTTVEVQKPSTLPKPGYGTFCP